LGRSLDTRYCGNVNKEQCRLKDKYFENNENWIKRKPFQNAQL